ncbi:MAG TPA: hypothetical protein VJ249_02645 [Candidatus Bathyarchaeia archaeon]|nr:hypothetical protein [Candidatus Bathyarchaeia archaeon]
MRRLFVVAGLVLVIVGVALTLYSVREVYFEENVVEVWGSVVRPIWPSRLNASGSSGDRGFWGRFMSRSSWFKLNLSFSGVVRVSVSSVQRDAEGSQTLVPVFSEVGAVFGQRVDVGGNGTYQVDLVNEGAVPVDVLPGSNVYAKENVAKNRVGSPYSVVGTLAALLGVVVMIFGLVAKSRKPMKVKRK